jgi:hypothetical protein
MARFGTIALKANFHRLILSQVIGDVRQTTPEDAARRTNVKHYTASIAVSPHQH